MLRIGPAGWSYPDWAGYVYPKRRPKGFHEATYLAEFFDTIEINTSFYQPLSPEHAAQWIERVAANPRFVFTSKLWQEFTHDTTSVGSGPTAADERAVRAGFEAVLLQLIRQYFERVQGTAGREVVDLMAARCPGRHDQRLGSPRQRRQ